MIRAFAQHYTSLAANIGGNDPVIGAFVSDLYHEYFSDKLWGMINDEHLLGEEIFQDDNRWLDDPAAAAAERR
ncbi:hypothetical protein NQU39_26155, partial [Escherichia coli]|uniref:hypothetical protein n=1 Tax=Escherichia coli TaxID=562 RepID=UPI0021179AC4